MITMMIMFTLAVVATYFLQNTNPVKMSVILMITGVFIFNLMYLSTSNLWFPILMYLVFMGGILMMFMILSSILPNEKTNKNFKSVWLILMLALIFLESKNEMYYTVVNSSIKTLMASSMIMLIMLLIITVYFLIIMTMVTHSRLPLRSTGMC